MSPWKKKYIFGDQKHCFDAVTPWQAVRTSLICGTFAVTVWPFTESWSFRGGNENLWVASSPFLGPSLARSREARFARQNRRACSQASKQKGKWTAKQSVFLRIQVRASSQTKGLEQGWKQRARLGRDAKNTNCVLKQQPHILQFIRSARLFRLSPFSRSRHRLLLSYYHFHSFLILHYIYYISLYTTFHREPTLKTALELLD